MMGSSCSPSRVEQSFKIISLQNLQWYRANYRQIDEDRLNTFSLIPQDDHDRREYQSIFEQMKKNKRYDPEFLMIESKETERCIASLLGLAICDALGASTQFMNFDKKGYQIIKTGFQDIRQAIENGVLDARAGRIGIWTDDCSMALCMADSLLYNQGKFIPIHLRYLFILWFFNGLNNGGRKHSIGLGGNIKISMEEFMKYPADYCITGDRFNSGNGSLMRLAPIPIFYRHNIKEAIDFSAKSSLTTHNGIEAEQCCKLMCSILVCLYKRKQGENPKEILDKACRQFKAEISSVNYLAKSMKQSVEDYNLLCERFGKKFKFFNRSTEDRNWDWKNKNFTYSNTRYQDKPGYVGSYCMDALAMALHTVWYTNSFKEVALWNANMGGDCDTVGAIAGQIAGAMYGIDADMLTLYSEMEDFKSGRYEVFLKGLKLAKGFKK